MSPRSVSSLLSFAMLAAGLPGMPEPPRALLGYPNRRPEPPLPPPADAVVHVETKGQRKRSRRERRGKR